MTGKHSDGNKQKKHLNVKRKEIRMKRKRGRGRKSLHTEICIYFHHEGEYVHFHSIQNQQTSHVF